MEIRWKKEISLIYDQFQNTTNRKMRQIRKKLPIIDEDIKNYILDAYLEMAQSKFKYRYYSWRKQVLENREEEFYMDEYLSAELVQMKTNEFFLFEN